MGASQNLGYLLGVSVIRFIVLWGLHRGPLILGNYHVDPCRVFGVCRDHDYKVHWVCRA